MAFFFSAGHCDGDGMDFGRTQTLIMVGCWFANCELLRLCKKIAASWFAITLVVVIGICSFSFFHSALLTEPVPPASPETYAGKKAIAFIVCYKFIILVWRVNPQCHPRFVMIVCCIVVGLDFDLHGLFDCWHGRAFVCARPQKAQQALPASRSPGWLTILYWRFFGTAENRSVTWALLRNTAAFAGAVYAIRRAEKWSIPDFLLQGYKPQMPPA